MDVDEIVGPHPAAPHPCGAILIAADGHSAHAIPHRTLDKDPVQRAALIAAMAQWIATHHVSPEFVTQDRIRREALARQGLVDPTRRLPTNTSTQKGNWAEILLAEYLAASSNAQIPVYRLRYNTNVDQSMKGDDVLAFDLSSNPVRILIGEAKFRSTPSKQIVDELIDSLEKSHRGSTPASLQFVADRLCESGNPALGAKVAECNVLFAQGRLRLDYVGMLVSSTGAHAHVERNAQTSVPRLAVISLVVSDPPGLVTDSFAGATALI